ncbi:Phosphodiest-domain-containing protein [Trichodelitschia bisporula]|uniref:Phosphodiest-domain-containing protein n=1 Tax=Trichodelitschia bisporula TaxID=703511 RepID=A0A6G1HNV7_9PEZI|nr:Phosphodiest-domain-containing protein [Trichodelitschia bisporula]
MEEGGEVSESLSRHSSESDLRRLGHIRDDKSSKKSVARRVALHLFITMLFLLFFLAAYRITQSNRKAQALLKAKLTFSNGTTLFAPTTIILSLDGFRADFLQRGLSPTLNKFISEGISPLHMLPSFPSVTFPNHYTMATGLYPESHGIVGNTFWDPELKDEFYYTHPEKALQPKWWGGEPLWLTAEQQNVRTAIHMWPGSEAHIGGVEPAHLDKFNPKEDLQRKVNRILEWLDLPGPDSPHAQSNSPRPQLIAAYVPNVDADGHQFGPNSTEIRTTIKTVDDMLGNLFAGLQARNLTNVINVVVVSDHGMATTSIDRVVQLDDLVDLSKVEHIDGWPLYGLRPKDPKDLDLLYQQVKEKADANANIEVYLRDKDMPERYHFSNNPRIAPLWIVPKTGWAIVTKKDFDIVKAKAEGAVFHPRGLHGYDHENSLMRAIFVARGPAFPHKPNSRVEVFQNTEVYNIVCDSIDVEPRPNNGTLRLPLRPVGLHSDDKAPKLDTPDDPPAASATPAVVDSPSDVLAASTSTSPSAAVSSLPGAPSTSPISSFKGEMAKDDTRVGTWFQWAHDKLEALKDQLFGLFDKESDKPTPLH